MTNEDVRALIDEAREAEGMPNAFDLLGLVTRLADALEASAVSSPSGKVLHEFHGDGVWRDEKGNVWTLQSEASEAVRRALVAAAQSHEPCGSCGHGQASHYTNDGCYAEGCFDVNAAKADPHEFVSVSSPPAITDENVATLARWASELHAADPVAFDAFHWAKAALAAALHPGGETNG